MIIDCSDCELAGTEHCEDCFVMAVLSHKNKDEPLILEPDEEEAIAALEEVGLIPVIKFKRKVG